jgi:Ca-activated chloride channel family protein
MNTTLPRILCAAAAATLVLAPSLLSAKSKPHATASGTLNVDASLSHKVIPNFAASEVYASIKIEAREFVSEARAPLNIALVIDRSGSMAGDKIAQARQAAARLVDTLGPKDRLSIVSYSSDVDVMVTSLPVTSENKATFHEAISGLTPDGFTFLSGGFDKGCDLVSNTIQEGSVNRVILMSDGQANRGVTNIPSLERKAEACLNKGVSLTTIGLGLDYNEALMAQMARAGAGNYHFVEDERSMARVFEAEAKGLTTTVAKKTNLVIDLAPGVEMLKLHGYKYRAKGNKVTVPLAEFVSKQRKEILVRLSVSAQKSGARPILGMRLEYEDMLNAKDVSNKLALSTSVSADEQVVKKNVEKKVIAHAQKVEVADTMERAMVEYEKGNQKQAAQMLEEQRSSMNKMRTAYDFADDDAFERVEGELSTMEKEVEENAPSSSSGKKLRKSKRKRSYDIANDAEMF